MLVAILVYAMFPDRKIGGVLKGINSPMDLIKKTLLAGVGIQLSWFLMMVLVDISTILTYTVGGLPSSIMPQVEKAADYKVMGVSVAVDMGDTKTQALDPFKYYGVLPAVQEGGAPLNIAACEVWSIDTGAGNKRDYIVGRAFDKIELGTGISMAEGYCLYQANLVSYVEWNSDASDFSGWGKSDKASINTFTKRLKYLETLVKDDPQLLSSNLSGGYFVDPNALQKT